jgi:hypothetical protein
VGPHWTIDLTALPLFHGLSVLSRALGERIVEHCLTERLDIDVERRIKPAENPELAALGCVGVKVLAERDVVAHVPDDVEGFQHHLRAVFGTLQQERWRRCLLPEDAATPTRALVFGFSVRDDFEYRFVLDRVPSGEGRRFFLRIAVENPRGRRLDLASVPHAVVDDLDAREYIAGSTRIAQTLRDLVQREADRGRRVHQERRQPRSFIFGQLEKGGLGHLTSLHLTWSERFSGWLTGVEPARLDGVLKKVLLLMEDQTARRELGAGRTIELADGDVQVFVDLSQQRRVLNVAFDQPRRRARLDAYLARMPALAAVVRRRAAERPLAGLSVLLIHHITSEVLGMVAALRALGCKDLTVLFVRYAGEIPNDYLEALLDLDRQTRCFALQHVADPGAVEGHFVLSHQFSPLAGLEVVEERLRSRPARYLDAMVALAVALVARQLERSRRVLVIEDGGYLMPVLTRRAAGGATLGALLAEHDDAPGPAALAERPLRKTLEERLVGSVEHTRNGFDRLVAAEREAGLVRPAYSIATSRIKVEEEAEEVAAGILAALESVYHAQGLVLGRRRPLVIGSRGAIGSRLVRALSAGRLQGGTVLGLDPKVPRPAGGEARLWRELPPARRRAVDLVIGVAGTSVLGAAEVEELVLHGTAPAITFASGSTKTVEFRGVADWVERLLAMARPRLRGRPVVVEPAEVTDPQSGRRYGTAFTLHAGAGRRALEKRLVFVADLTPVNFLFYGVPTEVMDRVMAQLLRASLALVHGVRTGKRATPRLWVVDRDIADRSLG